MRIPNKFIKAGYFWLPSTTEERLPGKLTISESGEGELEVLGVFGGKGKMFNSDLNIERINGIVEGEGPVTLDTCFYRKRNFSSVGIMQSLLRVHRVFVGVHYDDGEEIKFSSFTVSLEGFDEWLSVSGIKIKYGKKLRNASIKFVPPKEIRIRLTNDIHLLFTFGWTMPRGAKITEAQITQRSLIKLKSRKLMPLSDFILLIFRLNNFFCFATDETVTLTSVIATSREFRQKIGDREFETPIKIFYQSLPFSNKAPNVGSHEMLFDYGQVAGDLDKILVNWLNAYEHIEPALNLYFASKSGAHKYLEGKFLSLAQGLETFHRRSSKEKTMPEGEFNDLVGRLLEACTPARKDWLESSLKYANEISLRKRLRKMIEPFKSYYGGPRDREKLITGIVNTRNYFVHYDKNLEGKALSGAELWEVCMKMEGLFQLHLLKEIGFTSAAIEGIVKSNGQLSWKLTNQK